MLYLLAALLATAFAVHIDNPDHSYYSHQWMKVGKTNPNKKITLSFWLKNPNQDKLHDVLLEVSTPGNEKYGHFLSQEQARQLSAPTNEAVEAVTKWIQSYGLDPVPAASNNEVFKVTTTIAKAEEILNCEYHDFRSVTHPKEIVSRLKRKSNYDIPEEIAPHLSIVTPTHRLPVNRVIKRTFGKRVGAGQVTPSVLKNLYNIGDAEGMNSNNSQAICSFQRQYYSKTDLSDFWKTYDIDSCTVIDVPSDTPSGEKLEAELDTQYISAMGETITMQVWYNSGAFEDALLTWTNSAMNDPDCPLLFSVSYGATESYYGGSYINTLNNQLQQLGATGVSIFFASGDSGAGGGCAIPPFQPDYPASSPYVTAVGGVTGGEEHNNGGDIGESCWVDGGGGFSNYADTQSWQTTAVSDYLNSENDLPPTSDYNANGRGFPDISAQSVDFLITVNGRQEGVSGTSCASPTAAGIFALLNDLRLQNNMAQLGFANPWIYQTAGANSNAFNDCTEGYNKGCGVNKGFPAAAKWDPCSGYGSPNYSVLSGLVTQTGQERKEYRFD